MKELSIDLLKEFNVLFILFTLDSDGNFFNCILSIKLFNLKVITITFHIRNSFNSQFKTYQCVYIYILFLYTDRKCFSIVYLLVKA